MQRDLEGGKELSGASEHEVADAAQEANNTDLREENSLNDLASVYDDP